MKKVLLTLTAAALFTFGSVAPANAKTPAPKDTGANRSGDFDATPSNGNNQGNGNAPANGTVGNADGKNPPGQSKNDNNNGYECDNNKGVGNDGGNPAHTGCATTTTEQQQTTPTTSKTEVLGENIVKPGDAAATAGTFEQRVAELKAKQTAGLVLTPEENQTLAAGQLAYTGMTDWLAPLGLALVAFGYILVRFSRKPVGAHFA